MSTAIVPTKPSFMRRLAQVFQRTPADLTRTLVGNANAGGWSIVRGQTPSDFQGTGEEVRLRGWERHPVVHACIRAIADLVAAVPLEIIDRPPGEADAKVLPNHEALALFRGENGGESEFRFKARTATHFLTYGNAFSVLERNGTRGLPRWLRVIQPTAVQYVWLDPKTDMIRLYDWRDLQGQVHAGTPAENMLHFRDLDATDGLFGFPRGAAALRAIMADSEASEYVRQIVTNHGLPSLVVMVDGSPDMAELQAGQDRWRENWVTRGNRGGTSFMAGVKDLKQLAFSLADLEFPDLRATTREDICVAFNVDRRIIGVSSGTSDGGLSGEQFREARFRLIQQAVYPVMRCLEDEINRVLTPEYGEVWCRFSEEYIAAITEDVTQTSARVVSELNAKIRTVEEARDAVGLTVDMTATDHLAGGLTVAESQANAQAMGAAAIEAAQNPAPAGAFGGRAMLTRAMRLDKDEASALWGKFDETARKQEGPYERTANKLFKKEADEVRAMILAMLAAALIADDAFVAAALARVEADYAIGSAYYMAWLERYTKLIGQTAKIGATDVATQLGVPSSLEAPRMQAAIRSHATELATGVTETTKTAIREAILSGRAERLDIGAIAQRVEEMAFGEISAARAQTIAWTATIGALNVGAWEAAVIGNVVQAKQWLSQRDDRVRRTHVEADEQGWIPIEKVFSNGLHYPHEPGAPAQEVVNCRCALLFSDLPAGETESAASHRPARPGR